MKRKRNILDGLNCKITQSNTIMQNQKINLNIELHKNTCEICKIPVDNYDYHINKVCCSYDCFCVLYLSLQTCFLDEKNKDKYSFDDASLCSARASENELMIIDNNTI